MNSLCSAHSANIAQHDRTTYSLEGWTFWIEWEWSRDAADNILYVRHAENTMVHACVK